MGAVALRDPDHKPDNSSWLPHHLTLGFIKPFIFFKHHKKLCTCPCGTEVLLRSVLHITPYWFSWFNLPDITWKWRIVTFIQGKISVLTFMQRIYGHMVQCIFQSPQLVNVTVSGMKTKRSMEIAGFYGMSHKIVMYIAIEFECSTVRHVVWHF